jgi:hypothetical protein
VNVKTFKTGPVNFLPRPEDPFPWIELGYDRNRILQHIEGNVMKRISRVCLLFLVLTTNFPVSAMADEATEWTQIMLETLITGNVTGVVGSRHAAIVESAIYDAVNGIDRLYASFYVEPAAPASASRRAAAVQAAYASLLKLFPAQKEALDARLAASLGAIGAVPARTPPSRSRRAPHGDKP